MDEAGRRPRYMYLRTVSTVLTCTYHTYGTMVRTGYLMVVSMRDKIIRNILQVATTTPYGVLSTK